MHLPSTRAFNSRHLFLASVIILSVFHPACTRPPAPQSSFFPAYPETSLVQHAIPQSSSNASSWTLQKRLARSCEPLPFEPQTWMDLELDSYLLNYPNGDKMTLIDYATSKNASNFVCGLGSICNAGQMCYPVPDNDWYILFALQQWNSMNNILYMSIGYAISIVQAADLSGAIHAKQSLGVSAGMMEVSGTLAMDIMIMLGSETGPIGWALNVLNFGLTGGFGFWAYFQKVPKGPIIEGFGIWTDVVFHLATVEQEAHKRLSEGIKKAINSPISSPDGIYGVLKGGTYLSPAKVLPIPEIADKFRNVTMAMAMNLVLRGMVTIPNSAFSFGVMKD
ncbi:hypothetical protein PTTG_06276 [Puccinia triticina 1-1 BBBD Race 1]|uniref:DUF7872 domain-containing protein n=2 Tax=Puccinia triticina TaxID=208348 RepID=A0A0C4EZL7_PUCT1|nr:uncharacterized protein PtA15_7A603 [Puccinia triticina]OAV95610.1 hypothetical protein PTTG_06276 [Puccinia triticina 1-1 BBBD Race 1]WAQ86874.1 hypothetical protein PtA15_7A603 [Puccinia triticina]WAR56742.1 hypothetical protein PtB15_7B592 [Puccinia triticina]